MSQPLHSHALPADKDLFRATTGELHFISTPLWNTNTQKAVGKQLES
jgi:hypothetical protein